ncbi:MAG: hypothetical protein ACK4MF_01545 [Hyphomicrobiaceae bacterium]
MHFLKISGVEVEVRVSNAEDAAHAIKELRLARKQALHEKRGLQRDLRDAEKREGKAAETRRRANRRVERVDEPGGAMWRSLKAVARFAAGKPTPAAKPVAAAPDKPSAATLQRKIDAAEKLIHNIDACLLEIEAKLLAEKKRRP